MGIIDPIVGLFKLVIYIYNVLCLWEYSAKRKQNKKARLTHRAFLFLLDWCGSYLTTPYYLTRIFHEFTSLSRSNLISHIIF